MERTDLRGCDKTVTLCVRRSPCVVDVSTLLCLALMASLPARANRERWSCTKRRVAVDDERSMWLGVGR